MDKAGAVLQSFRYYPYGEAITGNTAERHRYTGKERDNESGNDYFGARYYWSGAGRWLGVDSVGGNDVIPQSFNRYSYAGNNPVNHLDPDGRSWWDGECDPIGWPGARVCYTLPTTPITKVVGKGGGGSRIGGRGSDMRDIAQKITDAKWAKGIQEANT